MPTLSSAARNAVLSDLRAEVAEVNRIFKSTATWEIKYDFIFDAHRLLIRPAIKELGLSFDWYDPDTSEEEDVTAYMNALNEFMATLGDL